MIEFQVVFGLALLILSFWLLSAVRRRSRRDLGRPVLGPVTPLARPDGVGAALFQAEGLFLGTAPLRESFTHRVRPTPLDLGMQAPAAMSVGLRGVQFARATGERLVIPADALRALRVETAADAHTSGLSGGGRSGGGGDTAAAGDLAAGDLAAGDLAAGDLAAGDWLVLTWDLGGTLLESGFRPRDPSDVAALVAAAGAVVSLVTSMRTDQQGAFVPTPPAPPAPRGRAEIHRHASSPPKETV